MSLRLVGCMQPNGELVDEADGQSEDAKHHGVGRYFFQPGLQNVGKFHDDRNRHDGEQYYRVFAFLSREMQHSFAIAFAFGLHDLRVHGVHD